MAESVLTLCPNCGRRLNVAPYQEMVTCSSCKQVSKIQYPWGVHQPKPEPPRQMVMQPVLPEKRGSDNRILWLVLILGLVLATAGAVTFGVILPRMRAAEQPPPPPDYFLEKHRRGTAEGNRLAGREKPGGHAWSECGHDTFDQGAEVCQLHRHAQHAGRRDLYRPRGGPVRTAG